jgi:hypothetical protein
MQVRFTVQVLGGTALWWAILYFSTRDVQRTNFLFTNTFQYLAVAWCCWFMYPYFLRVEAKQDVALAMGHDSVDLMAKMDEAIERRGERFDRLMTRMERLMEESEQGKGVLANRFETMFRHEMDLLRKEIRDERGRVDDEIGTALEEGEASVEETGEAAGESPGPAAADVDTCPFCGRFHEGPCLAPTSPLLRVCPLCSRDHDRWECPEADKAGG